MFSLNKAQLIGNATRDPEIRYIPSGQGVCNFSIATNRRYKNAQGEMQEETQFHDVVAWGKLAELITQFLKKGNKVYVEGRLQTRQWDAPDGSKRTRTEIVMEEFVLLTPKGTYSDASSKVEEIDLSAHQATESSKKTKTEADKPIPEPPVSQEEEINLDDIPF